MWQFISDFISGSAFVQAVLILGGVLLVAYAANRRLLAHYAKMPDDRQKQLMFRRQLFQVSMVLIAILVLILWLPLPSSELRTNLLYIFGGIISATIALSSTTLVGNVMAGAMLKIVNSCKPGDYIKVGDHRGKITEMDLLHTEIQTEQRDLTTLPNLYLVTHPVRVMQGDGTILSVDLSLGYDVPRHEIERALIEAANATGLEKPFVQIRDLGDFSVTYSISGKLGEVKHLLAKRRELRTRTLDELHRAGIEIVSPTFMNQRVFSKEDVFVPEVPEGEAGEVSQAAPDALVFDKAEKAESVTNMREQLADWEKQLKDREALVAGDASQEAKEAAAREIELLQEKIERLQAIIEKKEAKISSS